MKRILSVLLSCALVLSLVACGNGRAQSGDASNTASTGQTGESTSGSSKTDGDYPVIRINETAFYGEPPANGERIQEALNVILREKAHAEIEFVYVQMSNLATQLNLLLTGGDDSLDLLSGFWYAGVSELVANGQVREIDDLLASSGQGIQEIFEEYPEILHCGRINGKQYGIPSVCAWTCENCYLVMEDIVKEANIEFPEKIANLDELTPLLLKLKEANPDKYFIAGSTSPYWFPKTIDYLGDNNYLGVILDPANSTKIENYYESEYFLNFLENVKIWKANDLISPDPMSNNTAVLGNLQNKVTYGVTGYDYNLKNTIYEAEKQNSYDGPIVGTQIGEKYLTTANASTYMWYVTSFCKEPEAAMRVLNVLYTDPEAANILMNGLEGVTYVKDENGQLEYPEGVTNHQEAGWFAMYNAARPNGFLCPTWNYSRPDAYELLKEDNAKAIKSTALGFTPDLSAVADQYAACANVLAQYYAPIVNAVVDIDETLPVFQQALRDAGIEDVVAEEQRQFDAWRAAK